MISKRFIKVVPTSGSGTYAFQTNRTLEFQISGQGTVILPELRLQANFNAFSDTAGANRVAMAQDINLNAHTGVGSIIERVRIRSLKYSTKIMEYIDDYPRLCSALNCTMQSKNDFDCELSHTEFARGVGTASGQNLSQYDFANATAPAICDGLVLQSRKHLASALSISLRILAGMLNSSNIDLTEIGGLSISIDLSPNGVVLFGADAGTANYNLTDVELMVPLVMDGSVPSPNPEFDFLSFTSTKKNTSSTSSTLNDNLTLSGVLGVVQTHLPLGYYANSTQDSCALYNPGVKNLEYLLNGQRFPLATRMETGYDDTLTMNQNLDRSGEILRNGLSAFKPYATYSKSCCGVDTLSSWANRNGYGAYVQGVSFDQVSGMGINMQNANFQTVSAQSLQDPANNANTTEYKTYSFYLTRNIVQIDNGVVGITV